MVSPGKKVDAQGKAGLARIYPSMSRQELLVRRKGHEEIGAPMFIL